MNKVAQDFFSKYNKSISELPERYTTPLEVLAILVSIAAIFVNCGVLLVIFIGPRSFRTPTFFLISSLAVADMLTGVSVICAISIPVGVTPLSRIVLKGLAVVSFSASINNLLIIATDRYLKISDEERYLRVFTKKKSIIYIAIVWLLSVFVFLVVPAISWNCSHLCNCKNNGLCRCNDDLCSQSFTPFTKSYIFTGIIYYYASFSLMVAIYTLLFLYVRSTRSLIANAQAQNEEDKTNLQRCSIRKKQIETTKKLFSTIHKRREIRLAKTLCLVMGIFFICWIPITSLFIYDFLHCDQNLIFVFDYCLASAVIHPFVNPLIYTLRLPRMWNSFKMLAYATWRRVSMIPGKAFSKLRSFCTNNASTKNVRNKMDFKNRLAEETELLFQNGLPSKCKKFDDLLQDKLFNQNVYALIRQDVKAACELVKLKVHEKLKKSACKGETQIGHGEVDSEDSQVYYSAKTQFDINRKRRHSESDDFDEENTTEMDCNKHIEAVIEVLKPEMREMIEICNVVKTWMQLQIPEIQDGNNFGVEVQEEILEEVRRVEGDAEAFLKTISLYYLTRAEIISKFSKYPNVQDYIYAIEELDIKEFSTLRMMTLELRNYSVSIVDLFNKNKEKVFKPRGRNNASLLIY